MRIGEIVKKFNRAVYFVERVFVFVVRAIFFALIIGPLLASVFK